MRPARTDTESSWQWLDPRRHFAAALGWLAFGFIVVGALVTAQLVAHQVRERVVADTQMRLEEAAVQSADALRLQLQVRLAALQTTGLSWQLATDSDANLRLRLRALQRQFSELRWLGVLDAGGRLRVAVGRAADAPVLTGMSWVQHALPAPAVVRMDAAATFILAVPLTDAAGGPAGALVAGVPDGWLQAQIDRQQSHIAPHRQRHVLLLDPAGQVLAGTPSLHGSVVAADPAEAGRYLLGRAQVRAPDASDAVLPGWQLVVREDARDALMSGQRAYQGVLLSVLGVGLLAALAAMVMVHRLLRRLDSLARQAQAIREGSSQILDVPAGRDEIHAIGRTLAQVVAHLQGEKAALAQLNQELDARVAERTARIGQLVRQAHAADLVRQRLRMARIVHDTLAQSLMGLQTQIRVVRKFAPGWDAARLDAELALAAQAVADGLTEVRAAIGRMRQEGRHGSSLAAELAELLQRFGDRSGVRVAADIDCAAAGMDGARADVVLGIAREALRNIERHAGAAHVSVRLQREPAAADGAPGPGHWVLCIADDGAGFDPDGILDGHFGLAGLREQAEQLGAGLMVDSAPGHGCRISLRFPA